MTLSVIQDWTESEVLLTFGKHRTVEYRVYRDGRRCFQEIREPGGKHIHLLELPEGMKLDLGSYEVLLRYVLLDVVA
jgi:hypothetical protein